jgi:hypothetical protein
MDERTAADDGEIVHLHLAGELGAVRHDDMIIQDTVVRHVAVSHDEVIIADDGLALAESTAVDGDELTEDVIVADEGPGLFAVELQILRDRADNGGGEDMTVLAQFGIAADSSVGINDTSVADLYVPVDTNERTDLYILTDLSFGMNRC